MGCWPLEAAIVVSDGVVTWTDFRQPHRQDRDYRALGPFVFDRPQYEEAVHSAVDLLATFPD